MRFFNDPSGNTFKDGLAKLLVMPMDTGAWFGIIHEDNDTLSIPRSHFEPWGNGQTIQTALDQNITEILTLGCEAMTDDHSIVPFLQSISLGTSPVQFADVCVCVPAAWSNVVRCRQKTLPTKAGQKKPRFTKSISTRINTQNLLELDAHHRHCGCVDATANYQLDDKPHWLQQLDNQHFTSLTYKTDVFMVEQDRFNLIRKSLECIKQYNTRIIWTSDLCPLSHLEPESILIDLDECSARIHGNADASLPVQSISIDHTALFAELNALAGELPLELDTTYHHYTVKNADELNEKEHSLPSAFKHVLPSVSATFWNPLLQTLTEQTGDRQLTLIGDCALSLLSLKEAASAAGWNTDIRWPSLQPGTTASSRPISARVAHRAAESFHKTPFENVPLGNLYFRKASHLMQTATDSTIKKICAMLMV